ncbi:MAG: hypothetical protein IT384_01585 [Deltaproteobacteria bacterium]|nr:hypothetical protein [Deltaproteobacteria bacterium]
MGRTAFVSVLLLAAAGSPSARAANEDGVPLSPDAMLGGNSVASRDGSTGAWYNPAALGGLRRNSVQLTTSIYTLGIRRIDHLIETVLPWEQRSDSVSHTDFTSVPSGISVVLELGDAVGFSVGLFAPRREYFTLETRFSSTSPVLEDGSRLRHDQRVAYSGRVDANHGGIGFGLGLDDALRVGLGVFVVQETFELVFDFPYVLHDAASSGVEPLAFGGTSQRSLISRWGVRPTAGVQWELSSVFSVAMAVRGPLLSFATSGSATTLAYGAAPGALTHVLEESPEPVRLISRPARVYLAVEARLGAARIILETDLRHRLPDPGLGADQTVVNGRLATIVQVTDQAWIGGGLFTDLSGGDLAQSGDEIDYFGATGGVQFRTPSVVQALAGSDDWDMRTTLALRYGLGVGTVRGLRFDSTGDVGRPQEGAAVYHEASLNVGTVVEF